MSPDAIGTAVNRRLTPTSESLHTQVGSMSSIAAHSTLVVGTLRLETLSDATDLWLGELQRQAKSDRTIDTSDVCLTSSRISTRR
jgi:hypothetical protein